MRLGAIDAGIAVRCRRGVWGVEAGGSRAEPSPDALLDATSKLLRVLAASGPGDPLAAAGFALRPVANDDGGPVPTTVGPLPFGAFGIGVPTGWLNHRRLVALATAAESEGDGAVRLTPWRSVVMAGWTGKMVPAALEDAVTDPADPRLRVSACAGAPGCAAGLMPAAAVAARLAAELPTEATLHVSGCAKGCASPRTATLCLVGNRDGYDAVRRGRPGDAAAERGLDLEAAAALVRQVA